MARNKIQFQKSLSEPQFNELLGTENHCFEALKQLRWPKGFVCPACSHAKGYELAHRRLVQCAPCQAQTSITAGAVFHLTKLPLTT